MKIAIHSKNSGFTPKWIDYCRRKGIEYKLVNCYDTDIISQVQDCDIIMWHHHHGDVRDILIARQILTALEAAGKTVFPNHNTAWHFDDKVGQKYLFEALDLPAAPAYVFVEKEAALKWVNETTFPKVFKLRGGAGSSNVKLIKTKRAAVREINRCFGCGYAPFNRWEYCRERIRKWRESKDSIVGAFKGIGRLFIPPKSVKLRPYEKGYAYFQDFMPNNEYDTRVVVIGGKIAMGLRRKVRKGDFRASGSGNEIYNNIDPKIISIAFDAARKIKMQSIALDFVSDENGNPIIVEISFGFVATTATQYWTDDIVCHNAYIDLCDLQVEAALNEVQKR